MLKLDINLLWTVVNVLVMYAVLRKFLFKPVQDVLDKRQKMVDDELANAQDAKTKAEAALAAANDKLHNVDVEAAARREAYEKQAEVEKQRAAIAADRKSQVGTGDRSERIRTYNYPQLRVTDHRIGLTIYRLFDVLNGDLDEIIDALIAADRAEKLKESMENG